MLHLIKNNPFEMINFNDKGHFLRIYYIYSHSSVNISDVILPEKSDYLFMAHL